HFEARNVGQVADQRLDLLPSNPLNPSWKALRRQTPSGVGLGEAIDGLRYALGRNGSDRQPEGAGVVLPLTPHHELKVGNAPTVDVAAHAQKTNVGHVVLPARVEAAAALDVELARCLVESRPLHAQVPA